GQRNARGTPTLFVGGQRVVGAKPYGVLMKIVQDRLAAKP
ncbi:MAG: protein-disulfide isomerase, partial [Myxococcota bacterium]